MSWEEIAGLVAGPVTVIVCYFVIHPPHGSLTELALVIVGALVELTVVLIIAFHRTTKAIRRIDRTQRDVFGLLQQRVDRAEEFSLVLDYFGKEFPKSEMQQVWLNLVNRFQRTYDATNYIKMSEIYDTDWADAALNVQYAKKCSYPDNVVIRKVFLIDNEAENADLSKQLAKQRERGIQISFLFRRELENDEELRSKFKDLPSEDFGIFDKDHVLVWELKDRSVTKGRVLFGEDTVRRHQAFFDALFSKAGEKLGMVLSPLSDDARDAIRKWPTYKAPFLELDYALRCPGGWLYTFGAKPECLKYGAYSDGELVGFCLLDRAAKDANNAEFYVAIHPDKLGEGFGRAVTKAALQKGFHELQLRRIHLKVRTNHPLGVPFYKKLGFEAGDKFSEKINGVETEFYKMEITADKFLPQTGT